MYMPSPIVYSSLPEIVTLSPDNTIPVPMIPSNTLLEITEPLPAEMAPFVP